MRFQAHFQPCPMQCRARGSFRQGFPCEADHCRNLSVADAAQSVHPIGHPMSHSVQSEFSCPPWARMTAWSKRSFDLSAPFLRTRDAGLLPLLMLDTGFGHIPWAAITDSLIVDRLSCAGFVRWLASSLIGVGSQNPHPFPSVRSPSVVRSNNSPPRIIPQGGKVGEHGVESSGNKEWAVFHPHEAGSNFTDNPRHVLPESAALAGDSCPFSGCADVLAGKAARNDINTASPRVSVKGSNIIPDRERRETAVVLAGNQDGRCVGVELHSAHGSPAEQMPAEYAAPSPGEEGEFP